MFSEMIKKVRHQNKDTQQQMADKLGVSQRTVASWESGDRMPTYETLLQIAKLYQVSTDYLLGRDFYKHNVTLPSGQTVTILSTEKEPPTDGERTFLEQAMRRALNKNLVTSFPDVDPDQLRAFDEYVRQVVRSELHGRDGDS